MEAYVRPLKIRDSVPKYRIPIRNILDEWIENDAMLLAISNAAFQDKRKDSLERCRVDLLEKIFWIKEQYERIESDYLEEIDQQVRRYTRATTQKIENLTNRDQNTRGNLNYILTSLSRNLNADNLLSEVQAVFNLFEQAFLSEKSLWYRKNPIKRERTAPIFVEEENVSDEVKADADNLLSYKYSRLAINAYMSKLFAEKNVLHSKDMNLIDDHAYVMSLLSVLGSNDPGTFYCTDTLEGVYAQSPYRIPQMRYSRKEHE